jgi:glucose-6-phosphate 1-epimerase
MAHSLPTTHLNNDQFEARILHQGAQLLSFVPSGQKDWIFNNPNTPFEPEKEIYGGVPLVFPWFNLLIGHEDEAPNHGFARSAVWKFGRHNSDLSKRVYFLLSSEMVCEQGLASPHWNFEFAARMQFIFSDKKLDLRLDVQNNFEQTMRFECAFHTYFAVSDVRQTVVEGLPDGVWLGRAEVAPGKALQFPPFGARLFANSGGSVRIREPERTFRLKNIKGWRSTVVWNPGQAMEDIQGDDWTRFVCVEAGALRENAVELAPHQSYALNIEISVS